MVKIFLDGKNIEKKKTIKYWEKEKKCSNSQIKISTNKIITIIKKSNSSEKENKKRKTNRKL